MILAGRPVLSFSAGEPDSCRRILEGKNAAPMPGAAFLAPGFAHMSYACSEGKIRAGAARMGEFIRGLA